MAAFTLTASMQVQGPPEEVFAYLADVRRHMEWAGLEDGIGLTELDADSGPVQLGARFRSVGRENSSVMRDESLVTVFEPDRAFGFETLSRMELMTFRFRHHYALDGDSGGDATTLTYVGTTEPANLGAWLIWPLMPLLTRRAPRLLKRGLQRFKEGFEAQRVRRAAA